MTGKKKTEIISSSSSETVQAAKAFAQTLKPGTVVALQGNLGAGKTTFIKGIALGLGLKNSDEVKSPTFAIMHTYPTHPVLFHFDLYRLESQKEVESIGFEEFVNNPEAVICVEWPERGESLLPELAVRVTLEIQGPEKRKILIRRP